MALPFTPPTALAPMHGVGGPITRAVIATYGEIGLICVPFLRVTGQRLNLRLVRRHVVGVPGAALSVQLMGNDPAGLAAAAGALTTLGADVVDLNLGCPVRRVVRKGVGAALLEHPELVYELVSRMREKSRGLLSVKLRAGYAKSDRALEIASRAEAAGADFVVVHPRSRMAGYDGVADWSIVAEVKRALRIPVMGNGDCWYAADALRLMGETGCDGVMIGRAALRNPWIFRQLNQTWQGKAPHAPSGDDVLDHLHRIAADLGRETRQGSAPPLGCLKEHVRWLLRAIPDEPNPTASVLSRERWEDMLELLTALFAGRPPDQLDLGLEPTFGLERSGRVFQPEANTLPPPSAMV